MFPVTGLFRQTSCLDGNACQRKTCLFSHDSKHTERPSTILLDSLLRENATETSPIPNLVKPTDLPFKVAEETNPITPTTLKRPLQANSERPTKFHKTVCSREPVISQTPGTPPAVGHLRTLPNGSPMIAASPASSRVAIPLRQNMLTALYNQFLELYSAFNKSHPHLALSHASAQEDELYAQSSAPAYRNTVISSIAKLKKRPKPDSVSHASVGTESEVARRLTHVDTIQSLQLTSAALQPLLITLEQRTDLGYVTQNPEGPGGDVPTLENLRHPSCDRCHKNFVVEANIRSMQCQHHWGRVYSAKADGEKERKRVHSCCSQSEDSAGCSFGPHVFYDQDAKTLHSRYPFSTISGTSDTVREVVALDCEMVYTTGGMRLARVSIVDGDGEPVLDELIRMEEPIRVIDLNTRFSGITSLTEARLDLRALREVLNSHIGKETIIIGHALENDLKALRMIHERCVDTCALFPHRAGLPYRRSLKELSSQAGHCYSDGRWIGGPFFG